MQSLEKYIYTGEAYELALEYESLKQLSAAASYYLLEADRSNDATKEYMCLLRAALCFEKQGDRAGTVLNLLQKAVALKPELCEAKFHLARVYNLQGRYHEAYVMCTGPFNTTEADLDYPGKVGFNFERGLSAWWIGYLDESRDLMYQIYTSTNEEPYYSASYRNLKSIGYPRWLNRYTQDKHDKLKFKFPGSENIESNYSQTYQDMFVVTALNGKQNGTYLEIGSADPIMFNNTYLLEKLGWTGISIEIDFEEVAKFRLNRKNPCICGDATKIDYNSLISGTIDYLQVDCEPSETSFNILKKVIETGVTFNTITFEHDAHINRNVIEPSREYLRSKGYVLVVPNVAFDETSIYEDWWVHSSIYNPEMLVTDDIVMPRKYFLNNSPNG